MSSPDASSPTLYGTFVAAAVVLACRVLDSPGVVRAAAALERRELRAPALAPAAEVAIVTFAAVESGLLERRR